MCLELKMLAGGSVTQLKSTHMPGVSLGFCFIEAPSAQPEQREKR
jgi:hypothetical protein